METTARTWLVFNRASGSHDEALLGEIRSRLETGGFSIALEFDCQQQECPAANDPRLAEASHVVVLGGDGTLNTQLTNLQGWGGLALPLPGGTMNLLCKNLHGDDDPLAVVDRFVNGELAPRRLPMIIGESCSAFAELLAGPGAKWADVREDMREGALPAIIEDAVAAASEAAYGARVAVLKPAVGRSDGYPGVRLTPEARGLRVQGYGGEGLADFLRQGAAIVGRDFRDGPHEELGEAKSVTLGTPDKSPVELMADGERFTGGPTETFRLAELDLDLLGAPV